MNAAGQNSLVGPSFHIYLRRTIRTITVSVVLSPERNIGSPPIPKSPRNPFNTRSLIIIDTYFESLKLFHNQQTANIKQSRLSAPFSRRRVTLNETDSDVREVLQFSSFENKIIFCQSFEYVDARPRRSRRILKESAKYVFCPDAFPVVFQRLRVSSRVHPSFCRT